MWNLMKACVRFKLLRELHKQFEIFTIFVFVINITHQVSNCFYFMICLEMFKNATMQSINNQV